MPQLPSETVSDLHQHLKKIVTANYSGWIVEEKPIGVGGSAAVFRVSNNNSESNAFKLLDPKFSSGEFTVAAEKRIDLQKQFINHDCRALIQFYDLFEFDGIYVTVMENLPWDELKDHIGSIPKENIIPLIEQIVEVIQFLESKGMIHRDLKPENILISPDKSEIRIIDLGVLREISPIEDRIDLTDSGDHRPFLATAQYSSPEYLFRTMEPSENLWTALNIYQLGTIAYDLINGYHIFSESMALGNRYALALDVLVKKPIISQNAYDHFPELAKLCDKALVKDPYLRLALVSIEEFIQPTENELKSEIDKALERLEIIEAKGEELEFDKKVQREQRLNSLCEEIKTVLLQKYSPNLQFEIRQINPDSYQGYEIVAKRGDAYICNYEITLDSPVDTMSNLYNLILTSNHNSDQSPSNMTRAFDLSSDKDPTLLAQIIEYLETSILKNLDQISKQIS